MACTNKKIILFSSTEAENVHKTQHHRFVQLPCGVFLLLNHNELSVWRSLPVDNQKLARQTVYVALADGILTIL